MPHGFRSYLAQPHALNSPDPLAWEISILTPACSLTGRSADVTRLQQVHHVGR
jgi:hypothetical protein